jgi:hypothetical protein
MAFHDHPVLAMEDGAYLQVKNSGLQLVRGAIWRFEPGRPKVRLTA